MNKKAGVVFLAVTLPLVSCGGQDSPQSSDTSIKPLVINGTPSKLGDRPYQVSVFEPFAGGKGRKYTCGGTILSKKWILTAAHCKASNVGIIAGSLNRKGGQKIMAKRTIVHPEYKGSFDPNNDIALIELESDLEFNEFVSAAALPTKAIEQKHAASGSMLIISGWGHVSRDPITKPSDLREASLKVMTQEACQKAFPDIRAEKLICGEKNSKGQAGCYGDSGGPFASKVNGRHFVFGTASTAENAECSAATAFSRTSAFQGWITQVTGIQPEETRFFTAVKPIGMVRTSYYPSRNQGFRHSGGDISVIFNTFDKSKYTVTLERLLGKWKTQDTLKSKAPEHGQGRMKGEYPAGTYRFKIETSEKGKGGFYQIMGGYNTKESKSNKLPVADFDVVIDQLNVKFKDKSTDDGQIKQWAWDFGFIKSDPVNIQNPEMNYLSSGQFTVKLTVTDDRGAMNTISKQITVKSGKPKPDPKTIYDPVTKENIAELLEISNDRLVVLNFCDSWSGPCKGLQPSMSEKAKKDNGAWILGLVNIDKNSDLEDDFHGNVTPTSISFKKGKEVGRMIGSRDWESWIDEQIK